MRAIRATEYIDLFIQGEFVQARRHASQTPCPRCIGNLGFVTAFDERGRSISRRCRCQGIDHRIKMFNLAQVPARYLDSHLASYHPRDLTGIDALHRMTQFAWSFTPQSKGLLIYGGYGTGKTYLAVSLLKILTLSRGYLVRFIEFSHLLSTLQSEFGSDRAPRSQQGRGGSSERGGTMRSLIDAECLIIDELGEGRQSEWAQSVLEELITKRYNASGTTIITTNYDPRRRLLGTPEHLEARIGARLYSRLQQMCELVPLFGGDYRER